MVKVALCILSVIFIASDALRADVRLPSIISEHMVLMRSASVPIWGKADPQEEISVNVARKSAQTKAGGDGRWIVRLNLSDCAAGPFQMTIKAKNEIAIPDVLVGAVWLASGQSNMEMMLKATAGAEAEIAGSSNAQLRQFRVEKAISPEPADHCKGKWVLAGPETSGDFTAVGYYFGKNLQRTLKLPVGMINASWGGTYSEAWTSMDAISSVETLKNGEEERRKILAGYPAKKKTFVAEFGAWLTSNGHEDKSSPDAAQFAAEKISTDDWVRITLPGPISGGGLPSSGTIWIRKDIDVPSGAVGRGLDFKVLIGQLTGFERVYWNGELVSETPFEKYPGEGYARYFPIPPGHVRVGRNTIAIRIYAPAAAPRIAVDPNVFKAGPVSLVGEWLARTEFELPALPPDVVAHAPKAPARPPALLAGAIFNGMISPIVPYSLDGIIWYQGESNTGRAYEYRISFPLLINDWREKWQRPNLPFYFCQLPAYGPKQSAPRESEWAELRESQSLALKLPHTGQAVLIDLGESADIHPRNKRIVGDRLGLVALAKQYHHEVASSGPVYESMSIEEGKIRLKFDRAEGGLVARRLPPLHDVSTRIAITAPLVRNSPASDLEGFAVCGEDRHWVWADAKIEGDAVVVWSEQVRHPIAVRYAWADDPTCNLENGAGLPAAPFRTDEFPALTATHHFGPGI
jgi:sialate O-acetylesterase